MTNKKYDEALSQFPGKIIVVHCDTCDIDYNGEVTNEVKHPHSLHVMAFTCPKGHHSDARRHWKEKALHITEGDVISLRGLKVLWDVPEEEKDEIKNNCNNDSCDGCGNKTEEAAWLYINMKH
jgi:kynurenine formamidase